MAPRSEALVLRPYRSEDCPALIRLFQDTVHAVCGVDYNREQLEAWTHTPIEEIWNASFLAHRTLVAWLGDEPVGFADMDIGGDSCPGAYLDRLYVHKDHQGQGIATALCDALEAGSPFSRIQVHASLTARPFFIKRGYAELRRQTVERFGVKLDNFVMEKQLTR